MGPSFSCGQSARGRGRKLDFELECHRAVAQFDSWAMPSYTSSRKGGDGLFADQAELRAVEQHLRVRGAVERRKLKIASMRLRESWGALRRLRIVIDA
jgi:hypothetical protein